MAAHLPSSTPLARMPLRVGLFLWDIRALLIIASLALAGCLAFGVIFKTWQ